MPSFQSQKPSSLLLITISITFSLLLPIKVSSTESLSFSFTKFVPDELNLILQGDARVRPSGTLELTKVETGTPISGSLGRALYAAPVRIYDNITGIRTYSTGLKYKQKIT